MNRISTMAVAATALFLAPATMAANEEADGHAEDAAAAATGEATPVQLVSWDGDFEFMKTSRRLRIWRAHIDYRMTVDAEGNAIACELTEAFRRAYVNKSLCDILMEYHTFTPATDGTGATVEGSYSSRLSYVEIRERLN